MKKNIFTTVAILTIITLVLLCSHRDARSSTAYMDGKLRISGFVKETAFIRTTIKDEDKPYHDSRLHNSLTSALFEALYTMKESPDFTVRLFSGFKWWWQKAPMFDDQLNRSLSRNVSRDWKHPRRFDDDILTEAYIDIIKGPWQFKIGKQIVIWGQLDMTRVADVVNPLDLRKGVPGVDTWEEVKQGLWMIRAFYQSKLPGGLLFEMIFNPGDFKNIELPEEFTLYGPDGEDARPFGSSGPSFGIFEWQRERWTRDSPGFHTSNWELGFRVRGYTWGVDWTLLYWNALSDGPIADPRIVGQYTGKYIQSALLGGGPLGGLLGIGKDPSWNGVEVFDFKRYQTIGGTGQTFIESLWNTVWRFEWFYEIGTPYNKSTTGKSDADLYSATRKDAFGIAVQCSKSVSIPWFTQSKFATGRQFEFSLTYFYDKIFSFDDDLIVGDRNHAHGDSVTDTVILFLKQDLFNNSIVFIFTGNYYIKAGKWMAVPSFTYVFPGIHWRADLSYVAYGGAKREHVSRVSSTKDSIILRLRYEF